LDGLFVRSRLRCGGKDHDAAHLRRRHSACASARPPSSWLAEPKLTLRRREPRGFASWNQIDSWLRGLEALRHTPTIGTRPRRPVRSTSSSARRHRLEDRQPDDERNTRMRKKRTRITRITRIEPSCYLRNTDRGRRPSAARRAAPISTLLRPCSVHLMSNRRSGSV
jgi:hypothetical protein